MRIKSGSCDATAHYLQVSCSVCDAKICKKDVASHVHCDACGDLVQQQTESCGASPIGQSSAASLHVCTHRLVSCVCGAQARAMDMEAHRSTCEAVPHVCTYCNLPFKGAAFTAHEVCASVVLRKQAYVRVVKIDEDAGSTHMSENPTSALCMP